MRLKKLSNGGQLKIGAVLSYALIVLNTVFGLVVSPYILTKIGDGDYGVYKTIASFSATLLVLDLGIGTTVMRYTAKFRADGKKESIGNFAAMGMVEAGLMGLVLLIVCTGVYFSLDGIYADTFSVSELTLAKTLFLITIGNMLFTMVDNVLNGVVMGSNQFAFTNGFKLFVLLLRTGLIFVVLNFIPSAVVLVSISFGITVFSALVHYLYIRKKLGVRIKIIAWDKTLFRESLGYTALMFVQTVAVQANGNIDNVVIGAVAGSAAVTVYSFGIQMFSMYESLATSFSNLMLPTVSQKIAEGADDSQMQALVTRVGRLQFAVLGAALAGFAAVGKEFIWLWLGDGFEDVYALSLIMMVPVTLTLIENVCLSILRARNMMKFRTISLIVTAGINALITVVGMMFFNYYAAAIGTAISIVLGSICMMNIYYHKKIGFQVFKFYKDVFDRLIVCILVPAVVLVLLNRVLCGSWLALLVKVAVYCVIYAALLLLFGLNKSEKQMILGKFGGGRK